ncbi:BED zinc finger [Teladorsagia circumcincta]|uniref:BED zinc finger n=1 Tax=Teladorsagia circumcincta TaxID=45464 RepID=A0A2G9UPB2_TELCI|nr:BED zinc finger [Teladorsagia circumcincta]
MLRLKTTRHPLVGIYERFRLSRGNEQYDHSIALQPSMFYYAAAAAAGPSLSTPLDDAPATLQNKNTIDELNGANPQGARKRGSKRGRPTKNPVWTFFRRIDDKSVQCNMCARLVKSACATNMSKHLERHHQNAAAVTTSGPIDQVDFSAHKVVTSYDHYQNMQALQRPLPGVPWNPDRRGAKRNRRTKHPVWELFRRTTDGNAQCILCSVVVRSPCSSNFMGHLNRHHSEHYQDIYNRWLEGRVDMPSLPS